MGCLEYLVWDEEVIYLVIGRGLYELILYLLEIHRQLHDEFSLLCVTSLRGISHSLTNGL